MEGEEPIAFWDALGGEEPYYTGPKKTVRYRHSQIGKNNTNLLVLLQYWGEGGEGLHWSPFFKLPT